MKAMILSAGRGERMMPLTKDTPKPLIKVHDKTLIEHSIDTLKNAAITDVVINIAYLGEKIQAHLGDGDKFGINIEYSIEQNALETAGGIIQALSLLGDAHLLSSTLTYYTITIYLRLPYPTIHWRICY